MFLTRTSCHKTTQMQMITMDKCKWLLWCLARVGSFSQCASSNIWIRKIPWRRKW